MQIDLPKQFVKLAGKPILSYSLEMFQRCDFVVEILIVTKTEWFAFVQNEILSTGAFSKVSRLIEGGAERQDSVYAGFCRLSSHDLVAVHDAARPFISRQKFGDVVSACNRHGAAILAVPVKDTIKTGADGCVGQTLDRRNLWSVQTPQVFKYPLLEEAFRLAAASGVYQTDDSALVEAAGYKVRIVEGDAENFKITVPSDLLVAESIVRNWN
jgi:2-C-methyl-D-erythritol 4-phosphate cytidylyltransferase